MPTPSVGAADQLYHELQLALGTSFGLEREQGGGGTGSGVLGSIH